ncbi:M20 family metallo-hydrolase [Chelativorans sp. Marseille-P2723]|uniref:M20 family metallo-hydrolase n=1 Tax=Chelativorans sp. Marseille-P2723 TaxID=2709133 RepID=UPI00156F39D5|nr:M20 family metallo-hydrolase [Chelativorans sp. Marseille-P2723]
MSFRRDFSELKEIGVDPAGGWSRQAFSAADIAAHEWLLAKGRDAGLSARYDFFGNVILRLEGEGRAVLIGSHLDTVQNGGAFDGAIGVLAGLEVARRLKAENSPGLPVEVIAFRDEEGRFGPFTGSRAMAGLHDEQTLAKARGADGVLLADVMAAAGFAPANAPREWDDVAAWLELHIEQGPVLEAAGIGLGIVTSIAGQERLSLRFTGRADHAGTAPMDLRRDAFAGAARFAVEFRELIRSSTDPALRGTIGVIKLLPNQGNVVPEQVTLGLEIRSTHAETLSFMRERIEETAKKLALDEGLELRIRRLYSDGPVPMAPALQKVLADAAADLGHQAMFLPSGANHDTGIIGRIVPAAMLFVPSVDGRSHCPEEQTELEQIENAIDVLHRAVATLRSSHPPGLERAEVQ